MMASRAGNPMDDMLTGANIRYRLHTSNDLREGRILACADGYAWIADTQTQQVACIHKSGLIFDNIPNTGIRMPRPDEVKSLGPVQTGKLRSDQLESQLYDRTEAQKNSLLQNGDAFRQREVDISKENPISPRNFRLTQLGGHPDTRPPASNSGMYAAGSSDSSQNRRKSGRRSDRNSPRQRNSRSNGRYVKKENNDRDFQKSSTGHFSPTSDRDQQQQQQPSPVSPDEPQQPKGFYFYDDAGKLFYQQESGLTFYVDANNIFYPVNHRKSSRRRQRGGRPTVMPYQPHVVVGADPRLVPELFEGWTDEKGVWYPRSAPPRERSSVKKRPFELKARENPFLWQSKSMEERVQAQLEHYFSPGNLETDDYMKSLMDPRGYVEAKTICDFHRMRHHYVHVGLVLQAAGQSKLLKVRGTKIRARNAWWIHMRTFVPEEERVDSERDDEKETESYSPRDNGTKETDAKPSQAVNEDLEEVKGEAIEASQPATTENTSEETKFSKESGAAGNV